MANIVVIGTGYVGITTAAYLAHLGHSVIGSDVDVERVEGLNRGQVPILEDGLPELVREGLDGGRLAFMVGNARAVEEAEAEFVFLCVPTPQADDGSADLSYIESAARDIGPVLRSETVVINKSTVPVGSTLVVERALGRGDVAVVSNPEFLREGSAVFDALNPDRIVIGSEDQAAAIRVASLFSDIRAPVIVTDPASAETIKYASNAFLATKLSFVNAIANLCEAVGADVRDVIVGMGYDKRIGFEFLKPGPGWGGSCLVGSETVLAWHWDAAPRLLRLDQLFAEVDRLGPDRWSVLSWKPDELTPEFMPVKAFTARRYEGDVLEVRTKMGRRVTVTPDHPFVVGDGVNAAVAATKRADRLSTTDWLPVAQRVPHYIDAQPARLSLLDALPKAGITDEKVIVRLPAASRPDLERAAVGLPAARRHDVLRGNVLRLHECRAIGLDHRVGTFATATNGTYVPAEIELDESFWRMIGLYLAEGYITSDGSRDRICWSFHPTGEMDLANEVAQFWESYGVRVTQRRGTTAWVVSISSRILAAWFEHALGLGRDCYTKALPDIIWTQPESHKWELLRGLWDGDGSWSFLNGGPSVALEYGTASSKLADGMLRLLGDLSIVARLKVGRTSKSTVDTSWLLISGADQIEDARWLLPGDERRQVMQSMALQSKRIRPTGYRRLAKNAAWVRVASVSRRPFAGTVYSMEVPGADTFVTTGGLVTHNCFPKDTRALVRIAEDSGYDFSLLRGVIDVNEEQFERITSKVMRLAGGSVEGKTIAVWGLTFKARTDDTRRSPSLDVISRLRARGATVRAYDPGIRHRRTDDLEGIEVCDDAYAACEGASVLAVLTEWDEFRWVDFDKVGGLMTSRQLVDARNLLDPAAVRRHGFAYEGLGRP